MFPRTPVQLRASPPRQTRLCEKPSLRRVAFDATCFGYIFSFMETSDVSLNKEYKFYTYVLYSYKDKGLYIGYSENLKSRLASHAQGKNTSTKDRQPLKLIHYEYFINKKDAKAREEFLKSGYGRKQLKQFLKNTFRNNVY